jgi:hypothetical protein
MHCIITEGEKKEKKKKDSLTPKKPSDEYNIRGNRDHAPAKKPVRVYANARRQKKKINRHKKESREETSKRALFADCGK